MAPVTLLGKTISEGLDNVRVVVSFQLIRSNPPSAKL